MVGGVRGVGEGSSSKSLREGQKNFPWERRVWMGNSPFCFEN